MQDSLRTAGSHLYRLAPLLLELARAFSGAVAAMQGHPGPLALNPAWETDCMAYNQSMLTL